MFCVFLLDLAQKIFVFVFLLDANIENTMAKVTGPLLSLDARGSVAKTLVFAAWKGINYVRQRVIPTYSNTASQADVRELITEASQAWYSETSPIDTAYKALYDVAAEGQALSGFNLFIRDCFGKNYVASAYDGSLDIPTEPGDNTP